jgi:hypothetical protein
MRLTQATAGLAQMKIGVVVLMEMKIVNNQYPKSAMGYTIMCSKVASCTQGGVAHVWKEDNLKFEVKLVLFNHSLNTFTFQLAMGEEKFYVVGTYTLPNCMRGVEDLRRVAEECFMGCKMLIMGNLKLWGFWLRTLHRTITRVQWSWSQKRGMTRYYLQLDYILACAKERGILKRVRFRFPQFLHSYHHAIVGVVRAGRGGGGAEAV